MKKKSDYRINKILTTLGLAEKMGQVVGRVIRQLFSLRVNIN